MSWSLHDLAPICPVPHCPRYGTRHLLPHQEEIAEQVLRGSENYIYWQGGVGSAKTLLWGVLAASLAITIPRSRSILFRKDYGLNFETLWRFFMLAIEAACKQGIIRAEYMKLWSVKKQGEYTVCKLPNGSVVRAGQTKNWSEFMGPSYDAIFISDAMENNNFGEIFHGEGVVGGLQSRLRGQASSFYRLPNGTYKDMRRFLIESNPPPNLNELHSIFGKEPGVRTLPGTDITYRHIQSSSVQNDHNPASYIAEIASQHSNPGDIKRILEGKTVPYYGGIRVIETFQPEVHVDSFLVDKDLPLLVSIDQGGQHPAVTFSQIKRCSYEREHYITLSEISNLYDKTTIDLAEFESGDLLGIIPHLGLFYPEHFDYVAYKQVRSSLLKSVDNDASKLNAIVLQQHFAKVRFCIDKSANKRHPSNKDRQSDNSILLKQYGIRCRYRNNIGLDQSLNRVREIHKRLCVCNIPEILYDRNCLMLIDAYSGGYNYAKHKDGSHSDKPVEDHRYEDIADSHRYGLENFYFYSISEVEEQKPAGYVEERFPIQWPEISM